LFRALPLEGARAEVAERRMAPLSIVEDLDVFEERIARRGVLGMARTNDPDSASSQVYLMLGDSHFLNGQYTAFGKVTEGMGKLGPTPKKSHGLAGDIESISEAIRRYSWTALAALKGDQQVIARLEETEKLLKDLRKTLAK
jgi:cyclophilin family peptidyl-prolyl cis-trans isomerase